MIFRSAAQLSFNAHRSRLHQLAVSTLVIVLVLGAILANFWFLPSPGVVRASTAGPRTATSTSDCVNDASIGTLAWANPGDAAAVGGSDATASSSSDVTSQYLKCTNFGFGSVIPAGSTIDGIELTITREEEGFGDITDNAVRLVKGGVIGSTDKSSQAEWPLSLAAATYGGPTDLWGDTWTLADIANSNFGAAVSASIDSSFSISAGASVDAMQLTVYYTSPPVGLEQSGYRIFANTDSTDVGSPLAANNTPPVLPVVGQSFRLRALVHVSLNNLAQNAQTLSLQYAGKGTGTCAEPNGEPSTYQDVKTYQVLGESTNTGAITPGTVVDDNSTGSVSWSQPGQATANDGAYASTPFDLNQEMSHYLKSTNYGFAIPDGSTIDGIEVAVERREGGPDAGAQVVRDYRARLVKGGTIQSTDKAKSGSWPTTSTTTTYGSSSDLWGNTWTVADINNAGFGFAFAARTSHWIEETTAEVDVISITVYYTPPAENTDPILYYDNSTPANLAAATANANDPTHSGHTTVTQSYVEGGIFSNSVASIPNGQDGMWDFSLVDNAAPTGAVYCFRLVKGDGSLLDTYSIYPEVIMYGGAPPPSPTPGMDQRLRSGNWWSNGARQNMILD